MLLHDDPLKQLRNSQLFSIWILSISLNSEETQRMKRKLEFPTSIPYQGTARESTSTLEEEIQKKLFILNGLLLMLWVKQNTSLN
jgi:hypothetical protein